MLFKRFINAVVSIPVFLYVAWLLLCDSVIIENYLNLHHPEEYFRTGSFMFFMTIMVIAITLMALWIGSFFLLVFSVVGPLIMGDGLLCLTMGKGFMFLDDDGSIQEEFTEAQSFWRWDPVVRGRKIGEPSCCIF